MITAAHHMFDELIIARYAALRGPDEPTVASQYLKLLRQLHDTILDPDCGPTEADVIREQMDPLWEQLTDGEREQMHQALKRMK